MSTHAQQAQTLVEALPYIQKFTGKTIVVKYGGNAMISDELRQAVMKDIILLHLVGIRVVVVHGGGPEISDMLKKIGHQSHFVDGLRYTDEVTMDVVQSVHNEIRERIEMHKEAKVAEPLMISKEDVKAVLKECGVPEANVAKFSVDYDEAFGFEADLHPKNVIDNKKFEIKTPDVIIKVAPDRSDLIETRVIGGVKYIMICADEAVEVNGVNIHIADKEPATV